MRAMIAPMKVGHDTEASLRFIQRQHAHAVGLTEMDLGPTTALPLVHRVFGHTVRVFTRNKGPHSQEIPLLLKVAAFALGFRLLSFVLIPLSPNVGVKGAGNDRYLAELRYSRWGRVYTILHTHLDAEIQNHNPRSDRYGHWLIGTDRWQVTLPALRKIAAEAAAARKTSDCVIVMGDFNILPVGQGKSDLDSPYRFLRRLGYEVLNERVTLFAVWGARIKRHRVCPPGKNGWGSDHGAIVVDLARPSAKQRS